MKFKSYKVGVRVAGYDPYGQPLQEFEVKGTAEMFICIKSQSNTNDPRFAETTHTGLSKQKWIKEGMVIQDEDKFYVVKLANNEHRLATLALEVE